MKEWTATCQDRQPNGSPKQATILRVADNPLRAEVAVFTALFINVPTPFLAAPHPSRDGLVASGNYLEKTSRETSGLGRFSIAFSAQTPRRFESESGRAAVISYV